MISHTLRMIVVLALIPLLYSCCCTEESHDSDPRIEENHSDMELDHDEDITVREYSFEILPDQEAIEQVMLNQQEAWNRGDIEDFMNGYWRSDDLIFTSGGRIRRGWQATLDSYKANYTKETMGQLAFTDLEIVKTADNEAVVVGRWALSGLETTPKGGFTLVFRKVSEGWRITRDHTTSD